MAESGPWATIVTFEDERVRRATTETDATDLTKLGLNNRSFKLSIADGE